MPSTQRARARPSAAWSCGASRRDECRRSESATSAPASARSTQCATRCADILFAHHATKVRALEREIGVGRDAIEGGDQRHLPAHVRQLFGKADGHEIAVGVQHDHPLADLLAGEELLRRDEARQALHRCRGSDRGRRCRYRRRPIARRSPARSCQRHSPADRPPSPRPCPCMISTLGMRRSCVSRKSTTRNHSRRPGSSADVAQMSAQRRLGLDQMRRGSRAARARGRIRGPPGRRRRPEPIRRWLWARTFPDASRGGTPRARSGSACRRSARHIRSGQCTGCSRCIRRCRRRGPRRFFAAARDRRSRAAHNR